jgi:RHS repeat-associated protein
MAATYKYDPYGRTTSSSGTLASANVYRFSSKEIHPNSGFYYYGFRFYDPNTQRWLNRDPIGERGLESSGKSNRRALLPPAEVLEGANLYEAFRNTPIDLVDVNGLACGSGWSEGFVPDRDFLGRYDFTLACETHDRCYDSCGNSKAMCDEQFLEDMIAECRRRSGHDWPLSDCQMQARIYYLAVKWLGGGAYKAGQRCCEQTN